MGIAINQYIFYGIKLKYGELKSAFIKGNPENGEDLYENFCNNHSDNGYEKEIGEHMGITVISDGFNGRYEFVGKIYEKTIQGDYIDSFSMSMSNPKLNKMVIDVMLGLIPEIFQEIFKTDKKQLRKILEEKCEFFVFTHYH